MGKLNNIILALILMAVFCGMASAVELHVGFGQTYSTIQNAVNAAEGGDVIIVHAGSYDENVDVNKQLTLEGECADVAIVTAASSGDHVFEVTADCVNISGFAVRGATDSNMAGFYLGNVNYCNISENNVYGNDDGIILSGSSNNMLKNNTVSSNADDGIRLHSSSNYNTLTENIANSNNDGICLDGSSNYNTFTNNTVNSNTDDGIRLYNADNNNITYNLVQNNTKRGFYIYSGSTGNNISFNNIIENGNFNTETGGWEWQFYMDQYNSVEAKHNYWGAGMNNSTIDASIHDDEEGNGKVEFYPFEADPVPCAPGPDRVTITSFTPASPVNDTEGATRVFSITIDQTVNVTWYVNGTIVQDTNASVTTASYTNTSATLGVWNVSAVASNANGTDMQTWIWNVALSGDVTGDDVVNIGDAVLLFNWVSFPNERETTYALNRADNADVTGSGVVNIGDATLLFNWVSFVNERGTTYVLR